MSFNVKYASLSRWSLETQLPLPFAIRLYSLSLLNYSRKYIITRVAYRPRGSFLRGKGFNFRIAFESKSTARVRMHDFEATCIVYTTYIPRGSITHRKVSGMEWVESGAKRAPERTAAPRAASRENSCANVSCQCAKRIIVSGALRFIIIIGLGGNKRALGSREASGFGEIADFLASGPADGLSNMIDFMYIDTFLCGAVRRRRASLHSLGRFRQVSVFRQTLFLFFTRRLWESGYGRSRERTEGDCSRN